MKSIRISLIVYFLALLAVAFGTASVLVYRTAVRNLEDKQKLRRELAQRQAAEEIRTAEKEFDDKLVRLAQDAMIHSAQARLQWDRQAVALLHLMGLGLMDDTNSHVTRLFWMVAPYSEGRPYWQSPVPERTLTSALAYRMAQAVPLDSEELPHHLPGEHVYYQINGSWGPRWVSTSLLGSHTLDPTRSELASLQINIPKYDDVPLNGIKVRRAMIMRLETPRRFSIPLLPRTPINLFRNLGPPPNPGPPSDRRGGPPPRGGGPRGAADPRQGAPRGGPDPRQGGPGRGPGGRPGDSSLPYYVVQCAIETTERDHRIEELIQKYESDISQAEAEETEELAALRRRLLLLGLGTFLVTTLGGSLLVGIGLAPLRRLTDAVSRVTHKDFRLPLAANERLPSELGPIRDRLQETLDELRRAFEREKQASADISHELRTPVASLLTAIEVALKKPRSPEEYRQTLEDCRVSARQMRQLVERLMALARLDAGSDRIRPREVDVSRLVSECATLVRPLAGERGLELRVHCSKAVTWTTDPDKLREVLVNLLHNAIQYNQPTGAIDLSAQADNGWLDLQVRDTGIGIAPDAHEHIFERFYRSDPSRTGSELHAGLGLSIVKGYVSLLGGTIAVESKVGHGSTFRVRLPAVGQAA